MLLVTISGVPANAIGYQKNYIDWTPSYIENGEPIDIDHISAEVSGGFSINTNIEFINYKYYNDIWHRNLGTPILNITGKRTTLSFNREIMTDDPSTITFTYRINNYMKNIERYPATFLTEFATIGGILALF